jgi:hypothetical protein
VSRRRASTADSYPSRRRSSECAWQIERHLGPTAEARFLRTIVTRQLVVADMSLADYARCTELIETYTDLGLAWSTPR